MRYFLVFFSTLIALPASAQLSVGSSGLTVLPATILSVDGLNLTPSSNLILTNTLIQKTNTPVPGSPQGSISRVYNFSATVPFSGTAGIRYQPSELNGNTESDLQIAYQSAANGPHTTTNSSTVDASNHYVSTSFLNQNLVGLTAISRNAALPVTLINFLANNDNGNARLTWSTSWEYNTDRFAIEYSPDVEIWQTVGNVQAKGESTATNAYQFIHSDLVKGANYYRLKIIDKDATYAYSPIRSVVIDKLDKVAVYPNPAHEKLQLKGGTKKNIQRIGIYDAAGKLLEALSELPAEGINISHLAAGTYILRVEWQHSSGTSYSFVKD